MMSTEPLPLSSTPVTQTSVANPDSDAVAYERYFGATISRINAALDCYLDKQRYDGCEQSSGLWEAMRYGTLDGGKRIRSVLAVESCLTCGGNIEAILPTACAVEMVHSQSLIHDDLPCMDNDDFRRGKPSVHKAFGESTAVLAGDALIALAFGLIAKESQASKTGTDALIQVISDFSDVTSVKGLVNGQFVDILYEGKPFTQEIIEYIHTYKTGALFRFCTRAGALLAGASPPVVERFTQLGEVLGLTFQIVDDLLDIQASSDVLGKTAGKDQLQGKATYPAYFGVEASRKLVQELTQTSLALLSETSGLTSGYDSERLKRLVRFIADRVH